jgi:hypothetical protein
MIYKINRNYYSQIGNVEHKIKKYRRGTLKISVLKIAHNKSTVGKQHMYMFVFSYLVHGERGEFN